MTTIRLKNLRSAVVSDYSKIETRDAIMKAAKQQVRSEQVILIRRLMRQKGSSRTKLRSAQY
jgi:hypothetical protein